jgi:hypothetical protein
MTNLGVKVPQLVGKPPRSHTIIATLIWTMVAPPFLYLASLYWNWPASVFSQWRGWVFALAALACLLMATIAPTKYRVAIVGTRVRAWGRLL